METNKLDLNRMYHHYKEWIWAGGLLILALVSIFLVADSKWLESIHQDTIAYLDAKKATATTLAAAAAVSSIGLDMIPSDIGSSLSQNITELTNYLLVVFAAIWLQKYLVGLTGFITFKVLIPLSCVLFASNLFWKQEQLKQVASKLLILGLVIFITIPSSVLVSKSIEDTHQHSVEQTMKQLDKENQKLQKESEENEGFWSQITNFVGDLAEKATELVESAKVQLSNMLDAVAVMIITTCVIPILVFVFFLWVIKLILGLDIKVSLPKSSIFKTIKKPKTPSKIETT